MATLILTEKPSVARDFAQSLGARKRGDGFVEGEGFVITWAVGHLLELYEPHDYDSRWKRWDFGSLPILPRAVRYKPIKSSEKQLHIVHRLLARKDIDRVVIATDAGREGEVIARTILYSSLQGGDLSGEGGGGGKGKSGAPAPREDAGSDEKGDLTGTSRPVPPLYRFWTSQALTPSVIADVMAHLKEASEYDRLWRAGQARQIADWLVGMNFSRAATLKFRRDRELYSIGRVQTAVLSLIVDRKRERDRFKSEPYWILKALFRNPKGTWWGTWFKEEETRFLKKEDAEAAAAALRGAEGKVRSVKREKKKQPPPQLFSLTDLQREANAKYGFSAKETLDLAQRLYEDRKCLSYPRTDSRVLGEKNVDMAQKLVKDLGRAYPDLFAGIDAGRIHVKNKRVFNDAKLTDHHALVPMTPIPSAATPKERKIYDLVLKRFAAAFHPDYEYEATQVVTEAAKELFRTTGQTPLVAGWKAVYESGAQDEGGANGGGVEGGEGAPGVDGPEGTGGPPGSGADSGEDAQDGAQIPALERGDPATVTEIKLDEKMTQPPPDYNEALLLKDMTNPSRYVTEEELQKIFKGDVGLGTQATRAQIIETLIGREYVLRDKKKLLATEKGCYLIDAVRKLGGVRSIAMPEETARWEMELERVAVGAGDAEAFISGIRKFVENGVRAFKTSARPEAAPLGKCPACGGKIIEGNRGYGCDHWRERDGGCKFVVWKETDGRKIGRDAVRLLLESGKTPDMLFDAAGEKAGKRVKAALELLLDEETGKWGVRFVEAVKGGAGKGDGDETEEGVDAADGGAGSGAGAGKKRAPGRAKAAGSAGPGKSANATGGRSATTARGGKSAGPAGGGKNAAHADAPEGAGADVETGAEKSAGSGGRSAGTAGGGKRGANADATEGAGVDVETGAEKSAGSAGRNAGPAGGGKRAANADAPEVAGVGAETGAEKGAAGWKRGEGTSKGAVGGTEPGTFEAPGAAGTSGSTGSRGGSRSSSPPRMPSSPGAPPVDDAPPFPDDAAYAGYATSAGAVGGWEDDAPWPDDEGMSPGSAKGANRTPGAASSRSHDRSASAGDASRGATTAAASTGTPSTAESGAPGEGASDPEGSLGPCPKCGGAVVEGRKGFGCSNWKAQDGGCRFVIWKTMAGKDLSLDIVRSLLREGMTPVLDGFISKRGKPFSARLKFDADHKVVYEFP